MAIRNYVAALVTASMCAVPIAVAPTAIAATAASNDQSQQDEQTNHDLTPRTGIVAIPQTRVPSSQGLMPRSNWRHDHNARHHHTGRYRDSNNLTFR